MPPVEPMTRKPLEPAYAGDDQRHHFLVPAAFGSIASWKIRFVARDRRGRSLIRSNPAAGGDNEQIVVVQLGGGGARGLFYASFVPGATNGFQGTLEYEVRMEGTDPEGRARSKTIAKGTWTLMASRLPATP
jgi:hypothetical protein